MRRTEFGGAHPDEFLKTSDSCTGRSVPPGGSCSIKVRFAPSVASTAIGDPAAVRQHGRGRPHRLPRAAWGPRPRAAAARGRRGRPARPGPTGPAGPQGTNGTNGAAGPRGPAGADGRSGAAGPQGPGGAQGATGPRGPAGRDATVRCKPKRSRSGKVQRHLHGALRLRVGARPCACGSCAGAPSTRAPAARSGGPRRDPRPRPRAAAHARYRLLLTFVDRKGRATTVSQRVRLKPLGRRSGLRRQLPAGGVDVAARA